MRVPAIGIIALAMFGCHSDYTVIPREVEPLQLSLSSPTYGAFLGDAAVRVEGQVQPTVAKLWIEGERVEPDAQGHFSVDLPVDHAYRIVDVDAALGSQSDRIRVPVFRGQDPTETWPGAATARLLPSGYDQLGQGLGAMVDDMGWADQIIAAMPLIETDWFDLVPVGMLHDPTVVALSPAPVGVDVALTLANVALAYEIQIDWLGYTTDLSMGFETVAIGARAHPWLDEDGVLWISLSDAEITLADADLQLGPLDGWLAELVIDGLNGWIIEPLGELLLDVVLGLIGELEVGGPLAFETDLMGTMVAAAVSDVYGDMDGLGLGLGIGLGAAAPEGPPEIPTPTPDTPYADEAHAGIAVHEGLFQVLVGDVALGLLTQDITLSGGTGELIGSGIRALPGGDQIPDDVEAWCLEIEPGTAYVARMHEGTGDALATIYMPDLVVSADWRNEGSVCESWLTASLAMEAALVVEEGTKVGLSLDVPEGAVLRYEAKPGTWEEAEVVGALGDWLGTMVGLLGGALELDLADMLGGMDEGGLGAIAGDLQPEIVGTARLENADGTWTEGLYAVMVRLWAD